MKYCTKCGATLEDSAKFCHACGSPTVEQTSAEDNLPPSTPKTPSTKKRWGIAAQFDSIAAGQKPKFSYYTYLYGFFQLLYHKSYRLFSRTYLPCCVAMVIDLGLLAYTLNAIPAAGTLSAIAFLFLLIIAIWFVVVSIWMSRYYPQELYKQVQGDPDQIPANLLMPILGGIALVILAIAAVLIGYVLSPSVPYVLPEASSSSYTESLPEEEPSPVPTEVPSEASTPSDSNPAPEQPVEETSCLVPSAEPWKGAWCSPDGSELFIFEATVYTVDTYQTNEDGSITIYRADERDGTLYDIYTFSADETELTRADPAGNILGTYYRPSYDIAPNPLPEAYWGAYTMVEDNTISDYNPNGFTQLGPQDLFIIDAFRFGSFPYQELTDLGDGTWSAYFAIPPEGGEYRFGFTADGSDLYVSIYSTLDGSVYARYQRINQ